MANGGVRVKGDLGRDSGGEWKEIDDVSVWGMKVKLGLGVGVGVGVGVRVGVGVGCWKV